MTALNSEAGGDDRIRGWRDEPLTKEGHAEAAKIAQRLKNTDIDVLYHSPLQRAKDTAKAIAETTGAKLISLEDLKPWNVGEYTGQSSKEVHPILAKFCCDTPDKAIPKGESFDSFRTRAFKGFRQVLNGGSAIAQLRLVEAFSGGDPDSDLVCCKLSANFPVPFSVTDQRAARNCARAILFSSFRKSIVCESEFAK